MKKTILLIPLVLVLLLCSLQIVIDRDFWTDEAFTQLTVNKGMGVGEYSSFDVHPPGYYVLLTGWNLLNPGLLEHIWLRVFSLLCAAIFIVFAVQVMQRLSNDDALSLMVGILVALSTGIVYFGTEARSYMLAMALIAAALFAVLEKKWIVVGVIFAALPFIHYYAVVAIPFILLIGLIGGKEDIKSLAVVGGVAVVSTVTSLVVFALPQLARIDRAWFAMPDILSMISGMFYPFQIVAEEYGAWGLLVLLGFIGLMAVVVWKVWEEDKRMWVLLATLFLPVFGVLLAKYFTGAYHHKFFMGASIWGAMVAYVVLLKWKRWLWGIFMAFSILSIVLMFGAQTGQLQEMFGRVPCQGEKLVMHEASFTYHSFEAYSQERECDMRNILVSKINETDGRSAGYDVIDRNNIYYNNTPPDGNFYYVWSGGDEFGVLGYDEYGLLNSTCDTSIVLNEKDHGGLRLHGEGCR